MIRQRFFCVFGLSALVAGLMPLGLATMVLASVSISPALVEMSLDDKRPAGQFIIKNLGDETERYRIEASHFIFKEDGGLLRVSPDKNSLATWIKFNPKEFTLPPKTRRIVRFVIVPKGVVVPRKEYWASMELVSLKANNVAGVDKGGRTMNVRVLSSIMVPIFAASGELNYSTILDEINILPGKTERNIEAVIRNTGDGHLVVKANYEIIDASGTIVQKGTLGKNYILAGSRRVFVGTVQPDTPLKGDYTVRVSCSDSHLQQPVFSSVQHTW